MVTRECLRAHRSCLRQTPGTYVFRIACVTSAASAETPGARKTTTAVTSIQAQNPNTPTVETACVTS